jgi:Predicted membrane protein
MYGNYLHIIFSSVVIYFFIIVAIRLFGKKELSQLSIIDLVLILLISNAVQNAMVGQDTSLAGGLVAAAALFIANFLLKFAFRRFPRFGRLVQGEALLLIYKGKLNHANIRKAQLTLDELKESIREHGVAAIEEVDLAVLEMDGSISILSHEFQQRTVRKRKPRRSMANQAQS